MSSMSESDTVSGTRVAVEVTADMVGGVMTSGLMVEDLGRVSAESCAICCRRTDGNIAEFRAVPAQSDRETCKDTDISKFEFPASILHKMGTGIS